MQSEEDVGGVNGNNNVCKYPHGNMAFKSRARCDCVMQQRQLFRLFYVFSTFLKNKKNHPIPLKF
jgi:hypothetical protein